MLRGGNAHMNSSCKHDKYSSIWRQHSLQSTHNAVISGFGFINTFPHNGSSFVGNLLEFYIRFLLRALSPYSCSLKELFYILENRICFLSFSINIGSRGNHLVCKWEDRQSIITQKICVNNRALEVLVSEMFYLWESHASHRQSLY